MTLPVGDWPETKPVPVGFLKHDPFLMIQCPMCPAKLQPKNETTLRLAYTEKAGAVVICSRCSALYHIENVLEVLRHAYESQMGTASGRSLVLKEKVR